MMADTTTQAAALGADGNGIAKVDPFLRTSSGRAALPLEEHPAWPMIAKLPAVLAVNIPLRGFKVRHLLSLQAGQTVVSSWAVTEDVPLKAGALRIGWGEFEVVEQKMALRLTRLA